MLLLAAMRKIKFELDLIFSFLSYGGHSQAKFVKQKLEELKEPRNGNLLLQSAWLSTLHIKTEE